VLAVHGDISLAYFRCTPSGSSFLTMTVSFQDSMPEEAQPVYSKWLMLVERCRGDWRLRPSPAAILDMLEDMKGVNYCARLSLRSSSLLPELLIGL
jgi:hypothetical protein